MKVFFGGSRRWVEPAPIDEVVLGLPDKTIVVHGGAPGVDNIAGDAAHRRGLPVRVYPALADGRMWPWAGPVRNQVMLDREHPSSDGELIYRAYLLHKDPGLGKGTKDMLKRLEKADPSIEIWLKIGKLDWVLHRG